MNISELKQDVDFLCGSTSATYADADKIRNINIAYNEVAQLIWDSASGWQYDDSNATTLPLAKTTMVHNQDDYSLPTDAQRVHQVEVLDSEGNWRKLVPWDIHDSNLSYSESFQSPGQPLYYDLIGRSCRIIPAPHSAYCTLASGLAFYVDRDVTTFATSATTATPGFPKSFHRILSYAAAIDFTQDDNERRLYVQLKARLENSLVKFYDRRAVEHQAVIRPKTKRHWRQYT